jgi:integrase/recombinase XerD
MSLDLLIRDFLLSKEIEDGCSKNTVEAYKYDLAMFQTSLPPSVEIKSLNQLYIRGFLKVLKDKNYTKIGIARKIACLKSFFNFLEQSEMIDKNPMKVIHSPKIKAEESLPKFLTQEEMVHLMDTIREPKREPKSEPKPGESMGGGGNGIPYTTRKRIYLVIRLLYATMARIGEITTVKISDVDFKGNIIHLRGKGNKERIVPIDSETGKLLRDYLNERIYYNPSDPLLINKFGEPLSIRSIEKDIQLIKLKMGYAAEKKLTPHVFRHTGATHLRQEGMDISELQDILGHANPNTTRIYAKNDIGQITKEYQEKHPLARFRELKSMK